MKRLTVMWQEMYGEPEYRFQTDDPAVHRRMQKRKSFKLAVWGINKKLWVHRARFYSPQKARQTLQRITRSKIEKSTVKGEFWAQTYPIVDSKTNNSKDEV
jgi:hypothetical protein